MLELSAQNWSNDASVIDKYIINVFDNVFMCFNEFMCFSNLYCSLHYWQIDI